MAQYFPFARSATAPFQFTPTLDGIQYGCFVVWNAFGQRWYLNVFTLGGRLVLEKPAVSSDSLNLINLLGGFFSSEMYYDQPNGQFVVTP